jgi:hypothetical protein
MKLREERINQLRALGAGVLVDEEEIDLLAIQKKI